MVDSDDFIRVSILDWEKETLHKALIGVTEVPCPFNAPKLKGYHIEPQNDPQYDFDYTDFVPSQAFLTATNLPFIMSMISPPDPPAVLPAGMGEQWHRPDEWGRRLRLYPGLLPGRISYKVEGWRIALWLRLGEPWELDLQDIAARIHPRLFDKGMPCEMWSKKPDLMRTELNLRVKEYEQTTGAPSFENEGLSDRMYERINRLSEKQIRHNSSWLVYDDMDTTYTRQLANEWGSMFKSPCQRPTPHILAKIRKAKEDIHLKKTFYSQQAEEQSNHADSMKLWWQVKLPEQAADGETGSTTAMDTAGVDPGWARDQAGSEPLTPSGGASATPSAVTVVQHGITSSLTITQHGVTSSPTVVHPDVTSNLTAGSEVLISAGGTPATPNTVNAVQSEIPSDVDSEQHSYVTDEEMAELDRIMGFQRSMADPE